MRKFVIGIDEVGRGALAGPVTVAAVAMPSKLHPSVIPAKAGILHRSVLKDSKKLSAKQREAWFEYFDNHPKIDYAVARVYPRQIEKRNISGAANLAAMRAYKRIESRTMNHGSSCKIFLDGGLYLGNKDNIRENRRDDQSLSARTVVRGDEKIKAVAAASIIAKVSRDRAMVRLAKKYPHYGFEVHKGYGTKKHIAAIKKHGPSEAHRKSFAPVLNIV